MNTDICNIYRKLCLKNHIPVDELILSCLNKASVNGEINLSNTTITDISSLLIADTLKHVPTITILNLSDCLLSFDGLKNFLDVIYLLENLSKLNLKGNQIGNNITAYISKILLNNSSIIDLRLDWNNIGNSIDTFAQFCDSLMSNTVLVSLNLANNNLCQTCGFHLANLININKCLRSIDISWNCIGDEGAVLILKSLKNNEILINLNIQGNSVCHETSTMIAERLKQNKSNQMNQKDCQNSKRLLEHVASVDKNYQTQLNCLNNQYHNRIDELQSRLRILQVENQQQKQELEVLKNNNLKEKENNNANLNQVKKMKSELFMKTQSLNSLIKKISNEVSISDEENMDSLEDMDKIIYIIKQIKKKYTNKILKETKVHQKFVESLPKLKNELNTVKLELKELKTSVEIEINNYADELAAVNKLLISNMHHLKMSNKINNEMHLKNLTEQQKELHFSDEQTKMLVLLNTKLQTLHKEKTDLEIKLAEAETKCTVDTETVRALEISLILTKNELQKFHEKQLHNIATQNENAQLYSDAVSKEIDALKINLTEKDRQLQLNEMEKHKMSISHTTELARLKTQLHSEKLKLKEKRKEDQKLIEEIYLMLTQYVNNLREDNLEDTSN